MCLSITTLGNLIMSKIEATKYPAPGDLFEINDSKMHIYREGKGKPTVLFTCGSGSPSAYTEFRLLQKEISMHTRTCIYERPGYGWSEHTRSTRGTKNIVEEIRELLKKAKEEPPYLFVAHSMGAMEALLYAHKYPEEVCGIVFIDGTSPYKHVNYPKPSISKWGIRVIRLLNQLGLLRIAIELNTIPIMKERITLIPDELRKIEKSMIYKNLFNNMIIKEGEEVLLSANELIDCVDLGSMYLTVITAKESLDGLPGWEESQKNLLKLSSNSKQIIVEDANHISIHLKHKVLVAEAIKDILLKNKEVAI